MATCTCSTIKKSFVEWYPFENERDIELEKRTREGNPFMKFTKPINFTFTTNIQNQYKSGKSSSMRSLNYCEDQDINYMNLPRVL